MEEELKSLKKRNEQDLREIERLHQSCEQSKKQGDILQEQVRQLEQEYQKAHTYSGDLERAIQAKKDEEREKA